MNKPEIRSLKPETNGKHETTKQKRFDLEDRALIFARDARQFVGLLAKGVANIEDGKQVVRSSGSIGPNYIEANESLSKKDFVMRVKIAKKEARETIRWLELIIAQPELLAQKQRLLGEATGLMNILGSIERKVA